MFARAKIKETESLTNVYTDTIIFQISISCTLITIKPVVLSRGTSLVIRTHRSDTVISFWSILSPEMVLQKLRQHKIEACVARPLWRECL